jgi:hypothetical protein
VPAAGLGTEPRVLAPHAEVEVVPRQALQPGCEQRYRRQVRLRCGRQGPAAREAEVPMAIPVSSADGRGPVAQAYTARRKDSWGIVRDQ